MYGFVGISIVGSDVGTIEYVGKTDGDDDGDTDGDDDDGDGDGHGDGDDDGDDEGGRVGPAVGYAEGETTPTLHDVTVLVAPPDKPANDHVISCGDEPLLTDMV